MVSAVLGSLIKGFPPSSLTACTNLLKHALTGTSNSTNTATRGRTEASTMTDGSVEAGRPGGAGSTTRNQNSISHASLVSPTDSKSMICDAVDKTTHIRLKLLA